MNANTTAKLADDLLFGDKEIAEFLGRTPRRVNYLVVTGMIPSMKLGRNNVCSKSALRKHFEKLAGDDAEAA